MRKSSIIGGAAIIAALSGYGAWCAYKKHNPETAKEVKKGMTKMTKNVEKSIEDMM